MLLEDGSIHKPEQEQPPSEPCISPAAFLRGQRQASQSSLRRRGDAHASSTATPSTVAVGSSNAGRLLGLGLALGVGPDVFIKEPDRCASHQPQSPVLPVQAADHCQEFGEFEQHTKGFGSRMLSKMGFVAGQGLGKQGDGIASPLTSTQRPKRLGLGAGE